MSSPMFQLVSYNSPESQILVDNPDVYFFKTSFKRHSPFGKSIKELTFNDIKFGSVSRCRVSKDGDLLKDVALMINLPSLNVGQSIQQTTQCVKHLNLDCFCSKCKSQTSSNIYGWCNSISHVLVESYEFEVNGLTINKKYGEWLEVWNELSQTAEKRVGYNEMTGRRDPTTFKPSTFSDECEFILPLDFYFTKNAGLSFPLCAVTTDEIYINIKWAPFSKCWTSSSPSAPIPMCPGLNASIRAEYIYLDTQTREEMMSSQHLYLIEQVQRENPCMFQASNTSPSIPITISKSVKELIWFFRRSDIDTKSASLQEQDFTYGNDWFNFSCFRSRKNSVIKDPIKRSSLKLGGHEIFTKESSKVSRLYETYKNHTKTPSNYIYVHTFALKPEEHQPTGVLNFSHFGPGNGDMNFEMAKDIKSPYTINVYAVSYNYLVILKGGITLAY